MNVAIDLGNTLSKLAIFQNNSLIKIEKGLDLNNVLDKINSLNFKNLIVCSVTKSLVELEDLFSGYKHKIILNRNTLLPISNSYESPETLGYDRLAAAVGAKAYFPDDNCLIIDLGTAIKYDYVNDKNVFIGGIIGPGKEMRFKALHTFTKKLPLITSNKIPDLIGKNTQECIESGVINGMTAEINGIIEKYLEIGVSKVIICGGDAHLFESQIKYPTFAAPNLVLEGLNRILIHNVENI